MAFYLTDEAGKTLAAARAEDQVKLLAVVVDGKFLGATYFNESKITEFVPSAGFISSKVEAERIVEACR